MRFSKNITAMCLSVVLSAATVQAQESHHVVSPPVNEWQQLETGLEFGEFLAPQRSEVGDSLIRVLRIDPKYFELRLLNASALEQEQLYTAKEWCRQYGLVAAINASMYQKDYRSSVSLMQTKDHVNNPRLSKDRSILAFDRQSQHVPLVTMIDRQCENFDEWKEHYKSFVQSIRMISCKGKNVWRQQPQKWSTALIAIDQTGKVLFIHVRSHYSTHDLINSLLKLPLHISRAMYTEGGREAQLAIHSDEREYEFVGSYGGGFASTNNGRPIPNVVGIVRKEKRIK